MSSESNLLWDMIRKDEGDEEIIMQCLIHHPEYCSSYDTSSHKFPIDVALKRCLSIGVIRQMLSCYPDSCKEREDGYILLHDVMGSIESDDVVCAIMDAYPDAVSMKMKDAGYLPLRLACSYDCSMMIINKLLDIYPHATHIQDDIGYIPIFIAIWSECDNDIIHALLNVYPDTAHVRDKSGNLLLHYACHFRYPIDVIEKLLHINPGATMVKTKLGDLPIHVEYEHHRYDVLLKLVDAYPFSISMPDKSGANIPFYRILKEHDTCCATEFIVSLLDKHPVIAQRKMNGRLPLHIECQYHCRYEVIIKLLDSYPDAIHRKHCSSCVLHVAATNRNASIPVLQYLYNKYPPAIKDFNASNMLPLHCASLSYINTRLCNVHGSYIYHVFIANVKYLLHLYPEAVHIQPNHMLIDPNGFKLPLYRMLLHISSSILSKPHQVQRYHDLNYQHRSPLLHLLLQLSYHDVDIITNNLHHSHHEEMRSRYLLQMMKIAYDSYHVHAGYGWLRGDDLGQHLLRYIISYM